MKTGFLQGYPLVTIAMITYRSFDYIFEALDSVLMQDYPKYELIISDDASSNFPKDEIVQYITQNAADNLENLIIYSSNENLGIPGNLNTAIKQAKGEYWFHITPDDSFVNEKVVSLCVDEFQKLNALVLSTKRNMISESGEILKVEPDEWLFTLTQNLSPQELYRQICAGNFVCGAGTYFAMECFQKYGLYDDRCRGFEDYPKFLELLRNGVKIHFFDAITYKHRIGGLSTAEKLSPLFLESMRLTKEIYIYPYKELIMKGLWYDCSDVDMDKYLKALETIRYFLGKRKIRLNKKAHIVLIFNEMMERETEFVLKDDGYEHVETLLIHDFVIPVPSGGIKIIIFGTHISKLENDLKQRGYKANIDYFIFYDQELEMIWQAVKKERILEDRLRIAVYGTAKLAQITTDVLESYDIPIPFYIDSHKEKEGEQMGGKNIVHPDSLQQYNEKYDKIIIGSAAQAEIKETLIIVGISEERIISL